jgi:hypothetical protein
MSKLRHSIDGFNPGWAVNIYDRDRRLLCTLEPSHAWAFTIGIVLGGLMMLGWSGGDRHQLQPPHLSSPKTAPLTVD